MNRLVNECHLCEAWDKDSSTPPPELHPFQALWDTGATNSMISDDVVKRCGLVLIGYTNIQHAQGTTQNVPVYLVNIGLPNMVMIPGVKVAIGQLPNGIDVLIGMDIIGKGDFAVTKPGGRTKFSFRIPSQADIDFVKQDGPRNMMSAKRSTTPSAQKREAARRKRRN